MRLPRNLDRSLKERRDINLEDSGSQASSTNAFRIPLQRNTTVRGRGNPTRLGTGPPITTALSTIWHTNQSPIVRTPHNHIGHPGPADFRFPTSFSNTLTSEQGSMTEATEAGSHPQMTTNLSAAPSVVNPYSQSVLNNPSSLQSDREYLSPSIQGSSSQYVLGNGQRRDGTRGRPSPGSPRLRALFVVEYCKPAIARIDGASNGSWIYDDALIEITRGTSRRGNTHPSWPPGRHTLNEAGYNPTAGPLAQLTLRIRGEGDIPTPLSIVSRSQMGEGVDGMEVDMVLCQDFLRLVRFQNMIANGHRNMDNVPSLTLSGPSFWQMTGPLQPDVSSFYQNTSNSALPGSWPQPPVSDACPPWEILSSQGGSSGPVAASSTTAPDELFGPAPFNQE
ncbi:hypothetical protein GQX73_g1825 [Xylaria multiplex]|uniref:Uncharacterized protein n=1 Tax=Xylaria multiplex TaxID=323545 RepID=A0A7C8IWD3_9PEZI|nr:hypothetical protein GQX73_g1825 [Xylaria multiplex]